MSEDTKFRIGISKKSSVSEIALRAAVNARMPVMLVGAPGTSKTAMVNSMAEEMGYEVESIILSRMAETDVTGFPTKGEYKEGNENKPMTEYAPQYWQVNAMKKKKIILFFDEFSNAKPDVRASALTIIQDRVFPNGEPFPEDTIIIGAMNPVDSAADGSDLDKPTSNRMTFLNWKPSMESWLTGMPDNWGKGVSSANERKWRDLIVRFIRDQPGSLHNEGDDNGMGTHEAYGVDMNDSSAMAVLQYAWASRRSWDNLSRILGALHDAGITQDTNVEDEMIAGTVGYAEANRFRDWLRKNSSLNIAEILEDPRSFNGWGSILQDDANLILRSGMDSLSPDNDKMTVEYAQSIIDIFRLFHENDRGSLAASFLKDLTKKVVSLRSVLPKEDMNVLVQDAKDTLRLYNEIFNQRANNNS